MIDDVTLPERSPTAVARLSLDVAIRTVGVATRKRLTDSVRDFVGYTDPDGTASRHPEWAYNNITRMVYQPFNLNVRQREARLAGEGFRDRLDHLTLLYIAQAEEAVGLILVVGMRNGERRRDIKDRARAEVARIAAAFEGTLALAREAA